MANFIHKGALLRVLSAALSGTSLRGIARTEGIDINTVCRWLLILGEAAKILNLRTRGIITDCIEIDEQWSFVGVKSDNKRPDHPDDFGDRWTYLAVDKSSKAIVACHLGPRNAIAAAEFLTDFRGRIEGRPQIVSDGWHGYSTTVPEILGNAFPYIQIVKHTSGRRTTGIERVVKQGPDNPSVRATAAVERVNGYFRDWVRRCTRKSKAFSKSTRHHDAAIHLLVAFYNYIWTGRTRKKPPAFAAGLSSRTWTLEQLVTELLRLAGKVHPGFMPFPNFHHVLRALTRQTSPDPPDPGRRQLDPGDVAPDRRGRQHDHAPEPAGRTSLPPMAGHPRLRPEGPPNTS